MRPRIATTLACAVLAILFSEDAGASGQAKKRPPSRRSGAAPRKPPAAPPAEVPRQGSSPASDLQTGSSESDKARLAMVRARRELLEKEIARLQTQAESTLRDLDSIDLDLRLAAHRLDEAELEFKQTTRLLDATIKKVLSTKAKIEETRPRVLKSLAALSKLGELSYARLLFSLDDPADVLRGYRYVSRIAAADSEQIRIFRASLSELSGLEDQLRIRTAENVETRRRLSEARSALSNRRQGKQARFEEIAKERELQERLVEEYQQREAELLRLLGGAVEGEGGGTASLSRPIEPYRGEVPLRSLKGELAWPVSGTLVKKFGVERDPRYGTRTIQQGIEIDAFPEVEVHAVHAGRVVFADYFVGYGMLVIIDHGHREHTLYGRLGELKVAPGDDVEEGSLIGLLPDTRVTGSGLHFEVRVQGKPEDPLEWLKKP